MVEDALSPQTEDDQTQPIVDDDNLSSDGESQTDQQEVEIVLDGESGSQPGPSKTGGGYNRFIRRLKAAKDDTKEVSEALEIEREKNKLLQLALSQKDDGANEPPDPMSFDDGVTDPAYAKALQDHNQAFIAQEVRKATASIPAQPAVNHELERKLVSHGERAERLGVSDYADVQDKALDILGRETVTEIIAASDKSEVILYHLGKNPARAEEFRDLVSTNPVRAAMEIGRLEAGLTVKPRASTQPTPDPDVDVTGGTPTAGQPNKFQKRLDKLRDAAGETRDISAILALKREARDAGVTVK